MGDMSRWDKLAGLEGPVQAIVEYTGEPPVLPVRESVATLFEVLTGLDADLFGDPRFLLEKL